MNVDLTQYALYIILYIIHRVSIDTNTIILNPNQHVLLDIKETMIIQSLELNNILFILFICVSKCKSI